MSRIQFNQAGSHHASALVVSLLLISIVATTAAGENRAASQTTSTASRNPPFNGSIFGKRSTLPAFQGAEAIYNNGGPIDMSAALGAAAAMGVLEQQPTPTPLALLIQQQVALARASVSQCLAQQQRQQPQNAMASTYCAELLGIQMQDSSRDQENAAARTSWFTQLSA